MGVSLGIAVAPEPTAVPPPIALGTEDSQRLRAAHEPAILAGLGGHDVIVATHPQSQLAGGAGFDVLIAPVGAARMTPGPHGGLVWAGGDAGASIVLESGFNVVIGSPGPDVVRIFGGVNLILGAEGDDDVEVLGPSFSLVWTGPGDDSLCVARTGGLAIGGRAAETQTQCPEVAQLGEVVRAEVVGILSNHRAVVLSSGKFTMDDPEHIGSPEQEFAMEVLGVLSGPDPGPSKVYRPGGRGVFHDGASVNEFTVGSERWPRLGEPLHIMLRVNTYFEDPDNRWLFDSLPPGMPHVGTAVDTEDGIVEALPR